MKNLKDNATFIGMVTPHVVRHKTTWRVLNTYCPSQAVPAPEEAYGILNEKPRTELEELYFEFCKKAFKILKFDTTELQAEGHNDQVVFPDFQFEIFQKFPTK